MSKLLLSLFTILVLSGNSWAAILVMSPNGTYTTATSLSSAATRADCADKTIVVTSALSAVQSNISSATVHKWPTDRKLKIEKCGSIGNTTKFVIDSGDARNPEWWGFSTTASAATNAAAIMSAINSISYITTPGTTPGGGMIQFPAGIFSVAADVISLVAHHNITFQGVGSGRSYGQSIPGTILRFTTGTVGINIPNSASPYALAASNAVFRDIKIDGNNVLQYGIKFKGNPLFQDMAVEQCTRAGAWGVDEINMANFIHSSFSLNVHDSGGTAYGILIDGPTSTIFTMTECTVRENNIGISIKGASGWHISKTVIESNKASAIEIYQSTGGAYYPNTYNVMEKCWIENNGYSVQTYGQIWIHSVDDTSIYYFPAYIKFNSVYFSGGTNPIAAVQITSGRYLTFEHCSFNGNTIGYQVDTASGYAKHLQFKDCNGLTFKNNSLGAFNTILNSKDGPYSTAGGMMLQGQLGIQDFTLGKQGGMYIASKSATVAITAATSAVLTVSVPTNSKIIGCQLEVKAALAVANTWDAAYSGGSTQTIVSNYPVTINGAFTTFFNSFLVTDITNNTTNITITKNGGGSFTAQGEIAAVVYYWAMDRLTDY